MPTPAARAISSRLALAAFSAKTALAASSRRWRLRSASTRAFRTGLPLDLTGTRIDPLINEGPLRICKRRYPPLTSIMAGGQWRTGQREWCAQLKETRMTAAFDATSTTDNVLQGINLKGKRVLVTGVSAGLGVETARALAAHGAEVVGAVRDIAKAEQATTDVRAQATNGGS